MPELKEYERDRIINVIKSFGWVLVASSVIADKLDITFQKDVKGLTPDLKKFELDRIAGMVKNLGWSLVKSSFTDDTIQVEFEKIVKEVV